MRRYVTEAAETEEGTVPAGIPGKAKPAGVSNKADEAVRRIALAGNPNCGKTTLFNALTGARQRTANWAGVTVGTAVGYCRAADAEIVDLPGLYSVNGTSAEEEAARRVLSDPGAAGIGSVINVADATALSRSLVLTLSVIAAGIPLTLALNMTDVLEASGARVDAGRLSRMLGVRVVQICARRREGLRELAECAAEAKAPHGEISPAALRGMSERELARLAERIYARCVSGGDGRQSATERIDAVLCRPFFGTAAFVLVMAAVFLLTFGVGDALRTLSEGAVALVGGGARRMMESAGAPAWIVSLVCGGIVPGVGAVLAFVPELFVLFLCLAVLEDSGYMARAAWAAHPLMRRLGLSGKAALPMILGFGCTVPAVLSARMIDGKEARKHLTGALPFIPCTARLPVCVMFADMFFGSRRTLVAVSAYVLAVAAAIASVKVGAIRMRRSGANACNARESRVCRVSAEKSGSEGGKNGQNPLRIRLISRGKPLSRRIFGVCINCRGCAAEVTSDEPFIMEMPDFRSPGVRNVLRIALGRVGEFLRRAGSVILFASVAVWTLVNLSPEGLCVPSGSIGASLGRAVAPILRPVGLGQWQIILALICAVGAKELAVTTLTVIFAAPSAASLRLGLAGIGFGAPNALAFIAFVMLYVPCASTLAVIRSEQGTKVMLGCAVRCFAAAYAVSFVLFRIASAFV